MNLKATQSLQQGFTLIETLIYIGLFVLIMGSIVLATYNMIASTDKGQYRSLVQNEAQFLIRKVHFLFNDATSVSVSGSTMTIQYSSGPNKILSLSGNKLQLDGVNLNSDAAPVSTLVFSCLPVACTPRPTQVIMNFTLQNPFYSESFFTKKLLR